jgi:hypothetical protein
VIDLNKVWITYLAQFRLPASIIEWGGSWLGAHAGGGRGIGGQIKTATISHHTGTVREDHIASILYTIPLYAMSCTAMPVCNPCCAANAREKLPMAIFPLCHRWLAQTATSQFPRATLLSLNRHRAKPQVTNRNRRTRRKLSYPQAGQVHTVRRVRKTPPNDDDNDHNL